MGEYVVYCLLDNKDVKLDHAYKYLEIAIRDARLLASKYRNELKGANVADDFDENGHGEMTVTASEKIVKIGIQRICYTETDILS